MNSIKRFNRLVWTRFSESTRLHSRQLVLCRIAVGLFVLLIHPAKNAWVGELPQSLFDPPILSFGNLFSAFPTSLFFQTLDTLTILALVAFITGTRARIASIVFTIVHLMGANFAYSFGKIDHNILLPMAVFCHAFTNSGCQFALLPDPVRTFRLRGETLLAVLLSFGMFTAGLPKALIWFDLDMSRSGFLAWFLEGYYSLGRKHLLAPLVLRMPDLLVESFDYVAIVFELSPFLMLFLGRRFWRGWVLFALLFHLTSGLLLNIASYIHMPVYLAFFVNPVAWPEQSLKRLQVFGTCLGVGTGFVHLIAIWTPFDFVSIQVFLLRDDRYQLYFYTLCWCFLLAIAVRSYLYLYRQGDTTSGISSPSDAPDLAVAD